LIVEAAVGQDTQSAVQAMLAEARTEVSYADHKASMVLAALGIGFGAALGGLLAGDWRPSDLGDGEPWWWVGVVLAGMAVVSSAAATWPRFRTPRRPPRDMYFWGQVAAFRSFDEFSAALDQAPPDPDARARHQLWEVSRIVRMKYTLLRIAFLTAGGAVAVLGLSAGLAS
jgi:hypothetical protein